MLRRRVGRPDHVDSSLQGAMGAMLRRHMLLSACLSFVPFLVSTAKALPMVWTEVLEAITNSVDVIGKLATNIQTAVDKGLSIYDTFKLRNLKTALSSRLGSMNGINNRKKTNIKDLEDYITSDLTAPDWPTIQAEWKDISGKLDKLLSDMSGPDKDENLVKAAGFDNASDLESALKQQARIYKKLPEMPAPVSKNEHDTLKKVVAKLKELIAEVVKLESSIEAYVNKNG